MKRFGKLELAGWAVLGVSLVFLATRLVQRSLEPPVAKSRLLPVEAISEGSWWFTGKAAPANASADMTGLWEGQPYANLAEVTVPGQGMVLTPEGKRRWETVDHAKNPTSDCLPPGPVRTTSMTLPVMIVQRPDMVVFLSEFQRTFRIVYTDGRGHPPDMKDYPEWMGSSIGRWENNILSMDTIGINNRSWLDMAGHEHSDQLHLTEQYRLVDPNTIEMVTTFEDPVFFEKPFTIRRTLQRKIGDRILDYSCLDNEKDKQNLQPTFGDAGR